MTKISTTEKHTILSKSYSSSIHRNDDTLIQKWSQPRLVYDENNPPPKPGVSFIGDPGKTDPSAAHDCDINNIVATYHKTGVLPGVDTKLLFADVSDAPTYQDARNIIAQSDSQFMALDAKTRKRFDNDVSQFLDFVDDPKNAQELVSMGLATLRAPSPSPAGPDLPGGQPGPLDNASKAKPSSKTDES